MKDKLIQVIIIEEDRRTNKYSFEFNFKGYLKAYEELHNKE